MNAERQATLARAMAHPLRWTIVQEMRGGTASPSDLAERLEQPLGNVSYHVRELAKAGILEPVREEPRRGAVEHYYRLRRRPVISAKPVIRAAKGIGSVLVKEPA